MNKELIDKIIEYSVENSISEKESCEYYNFPYKSLYYYKKKFGIETVTRGKNPNSKKLRKYIIDDTYFSIPTEENSYWAGFIAADGNISKDFRKLTIGISAKDKEHLQRFLYCANSNYKISEFLTKEIYESCSVTIVSEQICKDLFNNFNITDKKSLTLVPPNLYKDNLIDSFIIGYIDGDGSINLFRPPLQQNLTISMLGTKHICEWIKNRFSEICNHEVGSISHDKKHNENTFSYGITNKFARIIFKHYFNIHVPKLDRKWSLEKYNYCITFRKKRKENTKYKEILKLKQLGMTQTEIAKKLNVTQANISWYYRQKTFIEMENETKELDKGVSNIEEDN